MYVVRSVCIHVEIIWRFQVHGRGSIRTSSHFKFSFQRNNDNGVWVHHVLLGLPLLQNASFVSEQLFDRKNRIKKKLRSGPMAQARVERALPLISLSRYIDCGCILCLWTLSGIELNLCKEILIRGIMKEPTEEKNQYDNMAQSRVERAPCSLWTFKLI
jgi:hypothetical protein